MTRKFIRTSFPRALISVTSGPFISPRAEFTYKCAQRLSKNHAHLLRNSRQRSHLSTQNKQSGAQFRKTSLSAHQERRQFGILLNEVLGLRRADIFRASAYTPGSHQFALSSFILCAHSRQLCSINIAHLSLHRPTLLEFFHKTKCTARSAKRVGGRAYFQT